MESLVSTTSTASRDILAEELTSLRALLRLNADGIGDEADLVLQLHQTRAAIDQFCAVLSERRDLLVTPESLPPISPSSSSATSPRLSLDSLPSWRSSRTSQFSVSEGETRRRFGLGGRRSLEPMKDMDIAELCEDWNMEVESPIDGDGDQDSGNNADEVSGADGEGDMDGVQDEAFRRLSHLLASLQAQAEAAVSAPSTPMKDDGTIVVDAEDLEDTQYQFPGVSSPLSKGRKRNSRLDTERPSRPEHLLRASFRRAHSLPYPSQKSHSLSSIPDENRSKSPQLERSGIPGVQANTGENSLLSLQAFNSSSIDLTNPSSSCPNFQSSSPSPGHLHRRVTSASLLSLPPKCIPRSPSIGTASITSSACSSPRSSLVLSRRSSTLIRDIGLEGLIGDIIETANKVNQTAIEHQGFMEWVWALLGGGAIVWFIVGWALQWGCQCKCSCPTGVKC